MKVATLLLGLSVVAAVGCGTKEAEEKPEPTLVRTAVAEEGSITEWVELSGRVTPPLTGTRLSRRRSPGGSCTRRPGGRDGRGGRPGRGARIETAALEDEVK